MKWNLDPTHTNVGFAVKHLAISTVRGSFKSFAASGETNEAGMPTALTMTLETPSISTNNDQRDAHLKSPDFFDVEQYPAMTFAATHISGTPDALVIAGELTMRGITKAVTLKGEIASPITDPWGNTRTSLTLSGKLSRKEWGLTWNQALEFGGFAVSDEVKLEIEAEAVAAKVAIAA